MPSDVTKGCYSNLDAGAALQFQLESIAYNIYVYIYIDNTIYIYTMYKINKLYIINIYIYRYLCYIYYIIAFATFLLAEATASVACELPSAGITEAKKPEQGLEFTRGCSSPEVLRPQFMHAFNKDLQMEICREDEICADAWAVVTKNSYKRM